MISFGRGTCGNFAKASELEWLETNGRGGYAMGTVSGANTRRYHGLFTIALKAPVNRFQMINRLEESLSFQGKRLDLSCQAYPDVVHPMGHLHLENFRMDPFPTWTYSVNDLRLEKSLFFRYGEDTVVVGYRLLSGPETVLEARPLFSGRDHHGIVHEDAKMSERIKIKDATLKASWGVGAPLTVLSTADFFKPESHWYNNQAYAWEERRGLESQEDVYSAGGFQFTLKEGQRGALVFCTEPVEISAEIIQAWEDEERNQRKKISKQSLARGPLAAALSQAADQFVVSRGDGLSVIAGYPWFEDWSRDALIALPGLFLATGRWPEAAQVLDTFARHLNKGLLPNNFPDDGGAVSYNAVDAPLWFIRAVQAYHKATHDDKVKDWLPAMREIADAYQQGTLHDIHMDRDGLVSVPAGAVAFTWMDARVKDQPVTPRGGKAVEIQALWYNALQFLVEIQMTFKEPTKGYDQLAAVAQKSFNEKFWNEAGGYLFDHIDGKKKNDEIRPNALLAVSLPYEILDQKRFRAVVDTAWRELYTSYGLRTLSPRHGTYHGAYNGPPGERDSVYHQGPTWPWLLGPFLTAFVKAYGPSDETKKRLHRFLAPFADHLGEAGLNSVSELCEGDPPHGARGCPFQAWSVAEILRVMWEEGLTL